MLAALRSLTVREIGVGALLFAAFLAALFVASLIVPGRVEEGVTLPDGHRERYRLNGLWLFLLTAAAALALGRSLAAVVEHFWGLFVAALVFSFVFPIYLLVRGRARAPAREPRARGALGLLSDYFYGVELNPKLFGLDLK